MHVHSLGLSVLVVVVLGIGGVGCQTSKDKEVARLAVGMDKGQALETAGNPDLTRRVKGSDHWVYRLIQDGSERVVQFSNGRAVYVGAPIPPKVSAAEQDELNEASNVAEAKRLATEDEMAKTSTSRLMDPMTTKDQESRKIAPRFVPIQ